MSNKKVDIDNDTFIAKTLNIEIGKGEELSFQMLEEFKGLDEKDDEERDE